jgi:hypothetical protein
VTRNQDQNATPRHRAGVHDDPTFGLPVQPYAHDAHRVNQDAADPSDAHEPSNENEENEVHWEELALPTFFSQLQPHTQELLRRARMQNTKVKLSQWDYKTKEWVPGAEVEARAARLKSKNVLTNAATPASHDEEENDMEENDDVFEADGLMTKRRKRTSGLPERTFEIKKWVQIPSAIAEKLPERKYLADRRPGMESLYSGAYKATNGFGTLGINPGAAPGGPGYDLGDGAGLGNAAGVLESGTAVQEPTPVRKNIPPKRKKKKLGGPGRKKANPNPTGWNAAATASGDVNMTDAATEDNQQSVANDGQTGEDGTAEAPGSGSDSEGEGSEEGELDEGGRSDNLALEHANLQQHTEPEATQVDQADGTPEAKLGTTEVAAHPSPAPAPTVTSTTAETQQATAVTSSPEPPLIQDQSEELPTEAVPMVESEPPQDTVMADMASTSAPEPDNVQTTAEASPTTSTSIPATTVTATATATATTPTAAIEAELVLEQAPIVEEIKPEAAMLEPADTQDVKVEEAVAPTFEEEPRLPTEQQEESSTGEPIQEVVATVVDETPATTELAEPEEAAAVPSTAPEPPEAEAKQEDGELDLLGGLEAAVEEEQRAV